MRKSVGQTIKQALGMKETPDRGAALRDLLNSRIDALNSTKPLRVFALSCCQRLLPFYARAQRRAEWGAFHRLAQISVELWDGCLHDLDSRPDVSNVKEKLFSLAPADFHTYKGQPVVSTHLFQDACGGHYSYCSYLESEDTKHIHDVSRICIDTVLCEAKLILLNMRGLRFPDVGQAWISPELQAKAEASTFYHLELYQQLCDLEVLSSPELLHDNCALESFVEGKRNVTINSFGDTFSKADIEARFSIEVDEEDQTASAFYKPDK